MKKFFPRLLALATLCLLLFSFATRHHKPKPFLNTPQRAATHQIRLFKLDEKTGKPTEDGMCTGTAIGPHALLTAGHCNEFGDDAAIQLDYSARYYHVLAVATDNRDHDIYLLDGPAFTHIIEVKAREAKPGEPITSYGTGGNDFPPHTYIGSVRTDINGGDLSDVSVYERTHAFSIPVVPGDSGSAVYASDGSIVALVTWQNGGDDSDEHEAVGMALNFSSDVYEKLRNLKETVNNGDDTSPTADAKSADHNGAASPNKPAQ